MKSIPTNTHSWWLRLLFQFFSKFPSAILGNGDRYSSLPIQELGLTQIFPPNCRWKAQYRGKKLRKLQNTNKTSVLIWTRLWALGNFESISLSGQWLIELQRCAGTKSCSAHEVLNTQHHQAITHFPSQFPVASLIDYHKHNSMRHTVTSSYTSWVSWG